MNVAHDLQRAGEVKDERLKALYEYKAVKDAKDMLKSQGDLKKDVSISVSIGSSEQTSEQREHIETVNTSSINAGGNVNITATAGDVNLKGTKINAEDVTIDAKKNINIVGADNKLESTGNTSSSSWSLGGTIGQGFFGNISNGSGRENGTSTTNVGSAINASGTVTLTSGEDTNIIGSQVTGDKVVADIKGNLNIGNKQDTDNYTAKNDNSGFGFSTGPTGSITGSSGQGKTNSDYASVTNQAGIFAGKSGFDITVGKNTDLKGAVISSNATPDKNKLSTDTLTFGDIQNEASYSSSSFGVNYATGKDVETKNKGLTPNIGVTASGDANSTTKSAIANGTIEVRSNPNQDLSSLSRDTSGSLNALGKIFDKKTVQEQQELASLFGQLAYEQVHSMSSKAKDAAQKELNAAEKNGASPEQIAALQAKVDAWSEGGANKIAMHAFVGYVMADLGGSSGISGAVGAGLNEAVQGELAKRFKDNPDMRQWASVLVGAAAASAVGGNAQTGASIAASGTKNNALNNVEIRELKSKLREALTREQPASKEEVMQMITEYYNLSGENAVYQILSSDFASPEGTSFKQFLSQYLGYDWDKAVQTLGGDNAAWENLKNHINNQYDNVIVRSTQAEQTVQQSYQSTSYAGLSNNRKEILYKIDTATNLGDKLVFAQEFIGQGWTERITSYRNSQYQLMIDNGVSSNLAAAGADAMTWELFGSAIGGVVGSGNVAGAGLGNLTKAEILAQNRAVGIAAEKIVAIRLQEQGYEIVGSQVTIRTSEGVRRVDHLVKDSSGNLIAIEVKSGNAVRSGTQIRKDIALENEGGVIAGNNAGEEFSGAIVKVGTIEIRVPRNEVVY